MIFILLLVSSIYAALDLNLNPVASFAINGARPQQIRVYHNIVFFKVDINAAYLYWIRIFESGNIGSLNQLRLTFPASGNDFNFFNHSTLGIYDFNSRIIPLCSHFIRSRYL